jgi:hypothetical protein
VNELVKLAELKPSVGGIDVYNVAERKKRSDEGSSTNDLWITI